MRSVYLLSLLGIAFGFIVARMAREELEVAEKYIWLFSDVMYFCIILTGGLVLAKINTVHVIIFTILNVIVLLLQVHKRHPYLTPIPIIVGFIPYYFAASQDFKLLLTCLVLLYAIPAGTLWQQKIWNTQ